MSWGSRLGALGSILGKGADGQGVLKSMTVAQQKLGSTVVEGIAGGGAVRVKISAGFTGCTSVTLDETLVAGLLGSASSAASARGMLEDLTRAAVTDALNKATAEAQQSVFALFSQVGQDASGSAPAGKPELK